MRKDVEEKIDAAEESQKKGQERLMRAAELGKSITPQEIAERLRRDVVGQDAAVDAVSVMLHQHIMTRVRRAASGMPAVRSVRIPPILLIGGTGCGKTTLMRGLSRISSLPWVHCDASMATEVGWYGETPAVDWLRAALNAADLDPTLASYSILMVDELDKKAASVGMTSQVSRSGAIDGMLRILEGGRHTVEMGEPGPAGGRRYSISMDSSNLMIICAGAFSGDPTAGRGLDEIIRRRLQGRRAVGFGAGGDARVSDMSSDELLRRVRPEDLIEYGLKGEIVGRLANIVVMPSLSRDAMRRIATETSDGPIKTLQHIASTMGWTLRFAPALVDLIVDRAVESGLGARGMHLYASQASRRAFLEVPGIIKQMGKRFITGYTHVQLRSDSIENGYYAVTHEKPGSRYPTTETAAEVVTPARAPGRRASAGGG